MLFSVIALPKKVTMASEELDPTFRRALNLLHSTSVDSAQQLKLMLDEAIKTRREQGAQSEDQVVAPRSLTEKLMLDEAIKTRREQGAQSEDQVVAPRSLTEGYKPEVINRVTEVATPRTAWAWAWAWAEMRPREKRVRPETAWAWAWAWGRR